MGHSPDDLFEAIKRNLEAAFAEGYMRGAAEQAYSNLANSRPKYLLEWTDELKKHFGANK